MAWPGKIEISHFTFTICEKLFITFDISIADSRDLDYSVYEKRHNTVSIKRLDNSQETKYKRAHVALNVFIE